MSYKKRHVLQVYARHTGQNLIDNREILLIQTHCTSSREKLITNGDRRQGHIEIPAHFLCQQHVFLHHVYVEPGLFWHVENKWSAILQRRRSYDAVEHNFERGLNRYATFDSQEQPLAKTQELHLQIEVDGDLHQDGLAIFADVVYFWANIQQNRFDFLEGCFLTADHERKVALLEGNYAA